MSPSLLSTSNNPLSGQATGLIGAYAPSLLGSLSSGNALSGLVAGLGEASTTVPTVTQWQHVRRRFSQLLANILTSQTQLEDGTKKQARVRAALNRHYWSTTSETDNSMLIGSWGKNTRGHPSRDVDILFLLPPDVYYRFEERAGNRQSQLLQEVKNILIETYSQTSLRGDGQVVLIPLNTIPIEVAVGFRFSDGSIRVCDTNNGGKYVQSTAEVELADLNLSDTKWNGNTRALVRLVKSWQSECNVPLKSFQLERLVIEFLDIWPYSRYDLFWYDWMVRDFFGYLRSCSNTTLTMPSTGEIVFLGNDWLSRTETAHASAISACENEYANVDLLAGFAWQKIFGTAAPLTVS